MRTMRVAKPSIAAALATLAMVALGACGSSNDEIVGQPQDAPVSQAPVVALPDGIPLPQDGSILDQPDTHKEGDARGWSAVALASPEQDAQAVVGALNEQLTAAGWSEQVTGSDADGVTISAKRRTGGQAQWLAVTVTPPLPGGGSAVTYRYATGEDPFVKGGKNQ